MQSWSFRLLCCLGLALPVPASALTLSTELEAQLVSNVGTTWVTVNLKNTYTSAVPVCTYVLGTFAGSAGNYTYPPAITRIRNITANSFELRIQGWEDTAATSSDVHCLIADEGAHTLADGRKFEAHTVLSDKTTGPASTDGNWQQANLENVSASIVNTYTLPVVLGQVISFNDARASVIYVNDCDNRANHPFQSGMADGMCVGKHIGRIASSRANETIGYIVAEGGTGTINNVPYQLGRGPDTVRGNTNNNSGFTYTQNSDYTVSVLTQAAEDGGDGGWAVLYGNDPLPNGSLRLAIDEEEVAGDRTRTHTTERVYYWSVAGSELTLVKSIVNDNGGTATLPDFTLSATGPANLSGVSGSLTVTNAIVPAGNYTLAETVVPGYTLSAINCTGSDTNGLDGLTIGQSADVTCTFINDDIGVDLSIVKTASTTNPNIGDVVTFTLTVTNSGPATATSIVVTDIVPAGFSYVASSMSGGDVRDDSDSAGAGLSWTLGSMAASSTVSLTFQATVLAP